VYKDSERVGGELKKEICKTDNRIRERISRILSDCAGRHRSFIKISVFIGRRDRSSTRTARRDCGPNAKARRRPHFHSQAHQEERRSAGVNDENCIASRNAASISIRPKGAPCAREGQQAHGRTDVRNVRTGRRRSISRCHGEVDVSRACRPVGFAGGAFALERPPADRPCVCFVSSSSMWRARRSANKRAAPGWRLTCTVHEEVVFTVAACVSE